MEGNEVYIEYISYRMPMIESVIVGYCLYRLVNPFMKNKKGAVCVGATYFMTMLILYKVPTMHFDIFTAYSIGTFCAFLVMCLTERRNYEQKAFIAVTFFSLHWFAFAMAEILCDRMYSFALDTEYMSLHPDMWFVLYVGVYVLNLTMGFLFMAISIWCILKNYEYKYLKMEKKELLVLTVPSVMGVLGFESMWYYRTSYIAESGRHSDIYDVLAIFFVWQQSLRLWWLLCSIKESRQGRKKNCRRNCLTHRWRACGGILNRWKTCIRISAVLSMT